MLYPLIFEPVYKKMLWGGEKIAKLRGVKPDSGNIGESWDITCRQHEMGVAANGKYSGKNFIDIINLDREKYLGTKLFGLEKFPLLVKLIDANFDLSIQVHPTDSYALANESEHSGKSEIWYILEAPTNGEIILGIKPGTSRAELEAALKAGNCADSFSKLKVSTGDIIYIPAGLPHALTSGSLVAEVQQNSDNTYRIYDYDRLDADGNPRALHIEKALDVIDFDGKLCAEQAHGSESIVNGARVTKYESGEYFSFYKYDIEDSLSESSDPERFYIFTCVSGYCEINTKNYCMDINKGDSIFIPAGLGDYRLTGECVLLKVSPTKDSL